MRLFLLLLLILVLGTLYRGWLLSTSGFDLYLDEAQYWYWAKNLDWGYYSKPPVIAWVIAASTGMCGNESEYCVRLASLFFYPLTALIIFFIGRRLFREDMGNQPAFWAAVVFFTLPAVSLSSLLISTDVALFFFWALALYAFIVAIQTNAGWAWILLGIAGGLGLMTKYTMGVFAISVLLFLLTSVNLRTFLVQRSLWLAALIAFVIFMPNLLWNLQYDFPTFQHTADIANLNSSGIHLDELGEFLFGQMGVFGILFFPLLLLAWLAVKTWWADWRLRLLSIFALSFLLVIVLQSLLGRANANWAAPTYVAGSLFLIGWFFLTKTAWKKYLLIIGLVLNLLLMVFIYHYQTIIRVAGVELNASTDIYKRLKGWEALGVQVQMLKQQYPEAVLLSQDREVLAEMAYYGDKQRPAEVVAWNPEHHMRHHYDLVTSMQQRVGQDFLYMGRYQENIAGFQSYFDHIEPLVTITIPVHSDFKRQYDVWLMKGFKGYPQ